VEAQSHRESSQRLCREGEAFGGRVKSRGCEISWSETGGLVSELEMIMAVGCLEREVDAWAAARLFVSPNSFSGVYWITGLSVHGRPLHPRHSVHLPVLSGSKGDHCTLFEFLSHVQLTLRGYFTQLLHQLVGAHSQDAALPGKTPVHRPCPALERKVIVPDGSVKIPSRPRKSNRQPIRSYCP